MPRCACCFWLAAWRSDLRPRSTSCPCTTLRPPCASCPFSQQALPHWWLQGACCGQFYARARALPSCRRPRVRLRASAPPPIALHVARRRHAPLCLATHGCCGSQRVPRVRVSVSWRRAARRWRPQLHLAPFLSRARTHMKINNKLLSSRPSLCCFCPSPLRARLRLHTGCT